MHYLSRSLIQRIAAANKHRGVVELHPLGLNSKNTTTQYSRLGHSNLRTCGTVVEAGQLSSPWSTAPNKFSRQWTEWARQKRSTLTPSALQTCEPHDDIFFSTVHFSQTFIYDAHVGSASEKDTRSTSVVQHPNE